jgi:hypothetical protein
MALVGTINSGNALSFKNRIHNGAFTVWQRGTSITGVGVDGRSVDRHWQWANAGGQVGRTTWAQETSDLPVGFGSGLNISVTTAHTSIGSTEGYAYNIRSEGQDFRDLQWGTANAKPLTVSFWAKSNKTGTYCLWINHSSASTKYNIREVSITNTWTYFSYTFSGDTAMAITNDTAGRISVYLGLMGGSGIKTGTAGDAWNTGYGFTTNQVNFFDSTSNVLRITGVQLEVGSTATSFEYRPYMTELTLCQRYFESGYFDGVGAFISGAGLTVGQWINFSVTKRGTSLAGTISRPDTPTYASATGTVQTQASGGSTAYRSAGVNSGYSNGWNTIWAGSDPRVTCWWWMGTEI